jgi:hypothetical protein
MRRAPDIQDLSPEVRAAWLQAGPALRRAGIDYTLTSGYRTGQRQGELYQAYLDRGRTGLPAAPPGGSAHESGMAIDLAIPPNQRDKALPILASYGFENRVKNDPVHFTYQPQGAAPPVLPRVPGTPGPPTQPTTTAAPAPAAAPTKPDWADNPRNLSRLRQGLGLDQPAAPAPAPEPAPEAAPVEEVAAPEDTADVTRLRQGLGLDESPEAPADDNLPDPREYAFGPLPPGPFAGTPGFDTSPLPKPAPAPAPAPAPPPSSPQAIASRPPPLGPISSPQVRQITANATGLLAQAIQTYAQKTGGRSYVADLVMRATLAPNAFARNMVLQEADAVGIKEAVAALSTRPT